MKNLLFPVFLIVFACIACGNTNNKIQLLSPVYIENDSVVKGQEFRVFYDKNTIIGKFQEIKNNDYSQENLYANMCFVAKSRSLYYTLELKPFQEDSSLLYTTFIAPSDAEFLNIEVLYRGMMFGQNFAFPVYNKDGTFSHRTNKFRMRMSMKPGEFKKIFMEDYEQYPYELDRRVELWWEHYDNRRDEMKIELDSCHAIYNNGKAQYSFEQLITTLAPICDAYSICGDIDMTYKTLCELDSILLIHRDEINIDYFNDIHLLGYLSSTLPEQKAKMKISQIKLIEKLFDVYEKTQNRYFIYELLLKSNGIELIKSTPAIEIRYSEFLYKQIKKDINENRLYYFARQESIFAFALQYFSDVKDYSKFFEIGTDGLSVLSKFNRNIISVDTNDYVSMFNGKGDGAYLMLIYNIADEHYQLGSSTLAKRMLLENLYTVETNQDIIASNFTPLLYEIYKSEKNIDSANYCIALSSFLEYKKAPYIYKKFLAYKKENGYDQFTLDDIKAKYDFSIKKLNAVPKLSLETSRGPYDLQNNAVEYKFIFNLSDECSACNKDIATMITKIRNNFKPNSYHIFVITNFEKANMEKAFGKDVFVVQHDKILSKALGFKDKDITNTMIIQKGKTLIFDDIDVPDYFIETKEILN